MREGIVVGVGSEEVDSEEGIVMGWVVRRWIVVGRIVREGIVRG